ncbi:MAG: DNA methyltransferase, partial [Polyangiaceae bacterium]
RYETILFFEKGKRRLTDLGVPDIIEAPRVRGGYPSEKPAAVVAVLVRQSSAQGELVIDPFMGSGAFGDAAVRLGRDFAGTDTSAQAREVARNRLRAAGARPARLLDRRETWAPPRGPHTIRGGEAA